MASTAAERLRYWIKFLNQPLEPRTIDGDIAALLAERDALVATLQRVRDLADEWDQRGEHGDASLTEFARALRAALDRGGDHAR